MQQLLSKNRLKQFCEQVINQRIAATKEAMDNAQSAANNEEKSSAGDKYETSRAMNHLEKDMHAKQLMNHLQELSALSTVNVQNNYTSPVKGAVIKCQHISFFIAAGLGKQIIDKVPVVFLSPTSPLAKSMTNKKIGDVIIFNGDNIIIDIY
jgi:transcription elongation GreA/GreB family factor